MQVRYQAALRPEVNGGGPPTVVKGVNANAIHWVCQETFANYASPLKRSTRALSFCPGRKVTTRRAVMGISSPVLGLRPGR